MAMRHDVDFAITTWLRDEAATFAAFDPGELEAGVGDVRQRRLRGTIRQRLLIDVTRGPSPRVRMLILAATVLLLALALVAAALFVGSERRPAPPIGPAGNGLIAYSDGDDLYVLSLDGVRSATNLEGIGRVGNAAFSPDGTSLAYFSSSVTSSPGSPERLFVAPLDRSVAPRDISGSVSVWNLDNPDAVPAWSPDGTNIAFTAFQIDTGRKGIAVASVDGGTVEFVATSMDDSSFTHPRWSPDGEWISYRDGGHDHDAPTQLMLIRADGSDRRAVARIPRQTLSYSELAWSLDSKRLVYSKRETVDHGDSVVAIYDVQVEAERVVSPDRVTAFAPAWSSDGQTIAYLEVGDGSVPMLVTVDGQGGNRRELGAVADCSLAWSPDSRYIAGYAVGCRDELVVVPVHDPAATTRLAAPGVTGPLAWQRVAP